jgi:hypothetical protein
MLLDEVIVNHIHEGNRSGQLKSGQASRFVQVKRRTTLIQIPKATVLI